MNPILTGLNELVFYCKKCLGLLKSRDRRFLVLFLMIQILLTGLDVLGVLLIAVIATVATSAVQETPTDGRVLQLLNFLNLEMATPQRIALTLTVGATSLLVAKSLLGFYVSKRSLSFLSSRDAEISSQLTRAILRQNLEELRGLTSFQYQNAITIGSSAVTTGLISQTTLLISELVLQFVLLATIFLFSPLISIGVFLYFSFFLVLLTTKLGKTAKFVSQEMNEMNIVTSKYLFDAIQNFRIVSTTQRQGFFSQKIKELRKRVARLSVDQAMLNVWSKYVFEVALLLSVVLFAAYAFIRFSASDAAALLAIFLASAYRIAPSIMKVQNAVVSIRGALGSARVFFTVFDHVVNYWTDLNTADLDSVRSRVADAEIGQPLLCFENVHFKFMDSRKLVLNNINLQINKGERIGFVGPSGGGKSTLIDLLIGALLPTSGAVTFNDTPAHIAIAKRAIKIGYVPQEVVLLAGTIKENIAFGIDTDGIDDVSIWELLDSVNMKGWVENLPTMLESKLGEFGSKISGGQRQRIGIARALFSKPDVLILDESTSALDAETEKGIMDFIMNLDSKVTLIVIAHRLSTVTNMDTLFYLSEGKIVARGTFEQLRQVVPNFDEQAKLMGIGNA